MLQNADQQRIDALMASIHPDDPLPTPANKIAACFHIIRIVREYNPTLAQRLVTLLEEEDYTSFYHSCNMLVEF